MKKFLFTTLLSFLTITASAQDYNKILTSIIENSKTDFSKITGKKIQSDEEGYVAYESKLNLIDQNAIIQKKEDGSETIYKHTSTHRYNESLENAAYLFVNENFSGDDYDIETDDRGYSGAYYVTRVYRKNDDFPFLIISLLSDVHINTKFQLIVFGKSTSRKE